MAGMVMATPHGRMGDVKRMVFVVGMMVVGISLMLWAGWHNLRERRLAMQKAQESKVAVDSGEEWDDDRNNRNRC